MNAWLPKLCRRSLVGLPTLALLLVGFYSHAATITYVNAGTQDSRVCVGFVNDSSGYTTNDFVSDPQASGMADTAYGPLPPAGQLASFDARTDARAELGTNLNNPLGAGVRSVFSPLTDVFSCQAHGETLLATGVYSSNAFAHSGDTTATAPMSWIINVDPSGAEVPGTPTDVTVTGSIAGLVSVAGASVADVSWNVATTSFGTVMTGAANQNVAGTTPFTDSGSITFTIPLGSTFELLVDYKLSTSGSGAGANSTGEISASLVEISAVIQPPDPSPGDQGSNPDAGSDPDPEPDAAGPEPAGDVAPPAVLPGGDDGGGGCASSPRTPMGDQTLVILFALLLGMVLNRWAWS